MSSTTPHDLSPILAGPHVYVLPALPVRWNWCLLEDVVAVANGLIRRLGGSHTWTPESFAQAFALAARSVRYPVGATNAPRKRIFRYALPDGLSLGAGPEIPEDTNRAGYQFVLELRHPCVGELFVAEGWAIDALKMVRAGATKVSIAWIVDGQRLLMCSTFDDGSASFDENMKLKSATSEVGRRVGWWR